MRTTFIPRGLSMRLGWVLATAVVGSAGPARAESEPCDCVTERQSVVSEKPCLIISTYATCGTSRVRNACDEPVTLVGWPLAGCEGATVCDEELLPNEEASFYFANDQRADPLQKGQVEERFEEEHYVVSVDGQEHDVVVSANVACVSRDTPSGGCSSTSTGGGLLLGGVLALLGAVLRRRRVAR
ncbi:MXAN_0125 family MYXO-CTERM protein [Myxococcus faecalis]|uniref:MXAN_0125 family MYXO-CTERM protein n=1 Tax=Myxococcus TaxID=32 RepID=UPI001CBC3835|nr:MXAN_0125 family MYXO-CTERM protein [Myxococcus sp. XM-1-1-1]